MKKILFKFFLLLAILFFNGTVTAYSLNAGGTSKLSFLEKSLNVNRDIQTFNTGFEISNQFLEVKINEVEIEESINHLSRKPLQNNPLVLFLIALLDTQEHSAIDLIRLKSFDFYIPSKRYILFEVFRI